MKKILLSLLLIYGVLGYSQINISSGGTHSTCSDTFVDSGGHPGNYTLNEDYTITICPDTPGQAIQLDYSIFQTDTLDYMVIYDGNIIDYNTILGTYNGFNVSLPFSIAATTNNASGCLTITFVSNNSYNTTGWLADVSCVAPVSPPACQGSGNGVSSAGCPSVVAGGSGLGNVDPTPVSCGDASTCRDIEADYLDLGDSSDYRVESIAYAPPYQFDCLKVPVSVGTDDVWSPPVNLPFDFCFYGNTYNQCMIGSNGTITFDLTNYNPGGSAGFSFANSLPSVVGDLFENTIYGVYHDLDPSVGGEVGYELVILDTGCRALVVAWHDVPMYQDNTILYTGMMVLYENTNIIEVYIEEKNIVGTWNDGNAIVGVQNVGATQAVVAPGRNGLDANWTVTNEAWRFVPDGASITSLAWYEGTTATGPVIGTTDIINVCPVATTTYTAEVTYTLCDGSVITDTDTTTLTINSCGSTSIDFDGANDYIDTPSFMGSLAEASQMSWVRLDSNFGSGGTPVNGNVQSAIGGTDPNNTIGGILTVGATTDNTNSANIDNVDPVVTLILDHTIPAGTVVTVSMTKDDNGGTATISDGVASLPVTFTNAQRDKAQHVLFTTGQSTNTITVTRTGGSVWVDGVSYSYTTAANAGMVMGQSNNKLFINPDGTLSGTVTTNTGTYTATTTSTIANEMWTHTASVYDGSTLKVYINGVEEVSVATAGVTLDVNAFRYAVGRDAELDDKYIHGFIQESRVYDVALTEVQLREQIYQPIQDNGGNVHGSAIPKDIDGGSLAWNNLIMYLKMDAIAAGITTDYSGAGNTATLMNMTTAQLRTAPIPYLANTSGTWTTMGTWQNGNVWDITSLPNKDWAIVQVTNNAKVTTTTSHTHLGLLVDAGSELEVQSDQLLENTSYLKLDGQLDLVGESQLIQTATSDLEVTSAGYLERDQQGKSSIYNYNFWCSPVNPINITANNTDYSVGAILQDGTNPANPQAITFTSAGYNGAAGVPITLADYWMFKYVNQPDMYSNWVQIRSTGTLKVGEGYIQKGTGTGTATQNYVYVGKPNNGVIQHTIGANNMYLVGNPYASALDANQFILDNIASVEDAGDVIGSGTSTGALYFWEHWGGGSHYLAAYQGGYATYNLTGGTLAIPDPDVSSIGSGSVTPKRYVPVGQGFFVQGSPTGGTIEFNNSQRAYKRESVGAENSVFIRSAATIEATTTSDEIQRVYFRFTTPEGPQRQLLLGVKSGLADGVNYGYDAKLLDTQPTDCSWSLEDSPYVIQAIGALYEDLELPLEIKVGTSGVCKFATESLANLSDGIEVYFIDKELNTTTQLEEGTAAEFELAEGVYNNRFYVVFKLAYEILDVEDVADTSDDLVVFYEGASQSIKLVNPTSFTVNNIKVYNALGQVVYSYAKEYQNVTEVSLPANVATGIYLVHFMYNDKQEVTKKLLIK